MALSRRFLVEGEHEVLSMRTHVKQIFFPAVLLVLIVFAAGFVAAIVPNGSVQRPGRVAVLVAGIVVVAWWCVRPFLRWLTTTYTITDKRLIEQRGVFTRTGRIIPLQRINDVSYEKQLSDRLLGCGTLVIRDASESAGVRMHDVPHVEEVHQTLSDLLLHLDGDEQRPAPLGRDDDGWGRAAAESSPR